MPVIERFRRPMPDRQHARPPASDPAIQAVPMGVPATLATEAPRLDPLVEALGLAVARNATRDRTLSAA